MVQLNNINYFIIFHRNLTLISHHVVTNYSVDLQNISYREIFEKILEPNNLDRYRQSQHCQFSCNNQYLRYLQEIENVIFQQHFNYLTLLININPEDA